MRVFTARKVGSTLFMSATSQDGNPMAASGVTGSAQCGVTLLDLMVALAITAILIMMAIPAFRHMLLSKRLTTTANDIVNVLNMARMEAIKRHTPVQFCSTSSVANGSDALGRACQNHGGDVYVSRSGGGGQPIRALNLKLGDGIVLKGNMKAVRFNGQGRGYDPTVKSTPFIGTVADICTRSFDRNNHRLVKFSGGSVIQIESQTDTCP